MPNQPPLQDPQRSTVIGKSLLMGGLLGECAAFFFLFYSLEGGSNTISNRNKIIAGCLFVLSVVMTVIYGLRNPHECGDGKEEAKTPTVVTAANMFPANNERSVAASNGNGATAASPLLNPQPQGSPQTPMR